MNTVSMASLTAVLKRIIDSAPTMPRLRERLLFMSISISEVTSVSIMRPTLKLLEYITPANVTL